jgi:hypothetical protein
VDSRLENEEAQFEADDPFNIFTFRRFFATFPMELPDTAETGCSWESSLGVWGI